MYTRLDGLKEYRLVVDYAAGDTSDLFEQGEASVLVTPKGYLYNTDFAEMVINAKHTILINEAERTMVYSDNQKSKQKTNMNELLLEGIDTLVGKADSVYFTLNGSERVYHLRFSNSYFDVVELTFTGSYLSKAVYFYNAAVAETAGMTAVCNMKVEEQPVYDARMLESQFYFTGAREKAVPTDTFTGYVLIYNTSFEESYTE